MKGWFQKQSPIRMGHGAGDRERSRLPVFLGSLPLLWCAWWYCQSGSQGLFLVTATMAAVAVALPRALTGTIRARVWTGVGILVLCLVGNVTRVTPPAGTQLVSYEYDRMVTVFFAVGLASLFFRPSRMGVTLLGLAGLPMTMLVVTRSVGHLPTVADGLLVWTFLGLLLAVDQAQRLTRARAAGGSSLGGREVAARLVLLVAVLALSAAFRPPLTGGVRLARQRLLGMMNSDNRSRGGGSHRGSAMSLSRMAALDFGEKVRMLLLIRSDTAPGYLREAVFTSYSAGHWAPSKPGAALTPVSAPPVVGGGTGTETVYRLLPGLDSGETRVWQVEVFAPDKLGGFCLPGLALALSCGGGAPLGETNGIVLCSEERMPDRFQIRVPRAAADGAYPGPVDPRDPVYRAIPSQLSGAVSNWVFDCEGLTSTSPVREAAMRVERYFTKHFIYRLGVRFKFTPDPLVDFMTRREGHCTFFASAAAMMFRSCGIPARVIGGYVATERHPWLAKTWVVRERDAHAWVEVWDRENGSWRRVDPTPADGIPGRYGNPGWIRLARDWISAGWRGFVANIERAGILNALADAGESVLLLLRQWLWNPGGGLLAACIIGFGWWRLRRRRAEEVRLQMVLAASMRDLERRLVPISLRRHSGETWDAWLSRIEPQMPAERQAVLRDWTEQYQRLRYRDEPDPSAAQTWIDQVRRKGSSGRCMPDSIHDLGA